MSAGADPMQVAVQMWMYSNELAQKKREQPDDTLISTYLHGEVDGEKISEFELNNFFVLLAVAGNETTRNATSHFMRLMHEHPDQFAAAARPTWTGCCPAPSRRRCASRRRSSLPAHRDSRTPRSAACASRRATRC